MFGLHSKLYKKDKEIEIVYINVQSVIDDIITTINQPFTTYVRNIDKLLLALILPTYSQNACLANNDSSTQLQNIFNRAINSNITSVSFIGYEVGGAYVLYFLEKMLSQTSNINNIDNIDPSVIKNVFLLASTFFLYSDINIPKNNINFHQMFGTKDYTSHFPYNMLARPPILGNEVKIIPFEYYNTTAFQYLSLFTTPDIYQYIIDEITN